MMPPIRKSDPFMEHPIKDLPEWAKLLYAEYLRQEMSNEDALFKCNTLEDTHRAFEMMMRAYVAGFRDRTKQLRPLPKLRDYPEKPDGKGLTSPSKPIQPGPFNKGR